MHKPVINIDEIKLESYENGRFQGSWGSISAHIGAKQLGYNYSVVKPGKSACPFHSHQVGEEMFLILEGEGTLRYGNEKFPLRKLDVIACPAGNRETAHQIVNTGTTDLKYLSLSTKDRADVCEYPDSNKVGVFVGEWGKMDLRLIVKADQGVDYYDGEAK